MSNWLEQIHCTYFFFFETLELTLGFVLGVLGIELFASDESVAFEYGQWLVLELVITVPTNTN